MKTFEHLDKMMDDILVNDISEMCPFSFGNPNNTHTHTQPTSSKSDGQICRNKK